MKHIKSQVEVFSIIGLLSLLVSMQSWSQSTCSQKLKEAQKMYEQGILENIPSYLNSCTNGGFSKVEQIQAYRLIILTYLFLDEQKEAERYMGLLLSKEPDFVPNATLDPIEFVYLYEKYNIVPYLSFGVSVGANQTNPRMVHQFGVFNTETSGTSYTPNLGIQLGLCADIALYKKLFLSIDVQFLNKNFASKSPVFANSELSVTETQNILALPLSFKYAAGNNKLKIFIRAGLVPSYLLTSSAKMIRSSGTLVDFQGADIDLKSQRTSINLAPILGLGLQYKLGYGYLFIDARYAYGVTNISDQNKRYQYFDTQLTNYGYIESDVALRNIHGTVGYMYSLYHIKRKKIAKSIE